MLQTQTRTPEWTVAMTPTAETSLADLRQIRQQWIDQAAELQYFDHLLEIARELGQPIETSSHGTYHILVHRVPGLPVSPVVLVQREHTGRLIVRGGWSQDRSTTIWEAVERLTVYLCPGFNIDKRDRNNFPYLPDAVTVCRYECSSHPSGGEERLIIPGQWLSSVLSSRPTALEHAKARGIETHETERQALLDELLVGVEI